jgi:hypothetical protein
VQLRRAALALALLAVSPAAFAQGVQWSRVGSFTGPRGTTTHNGAGNCMGGNCAWNGTTNGPAGRFVTNQGSASCAGGTCTGSGAIVGPHGGTIAHSGSATFLR